jgi:hypothetical protein
MNPQISLTDEEVATINVLASIRSISARNSNVKDMKRSDLNGVEIDLDGLMAEWAFCKYKNVFPDLVASPRSGTCDAIVNGLRIDVKSTRYKNGRLLVTLKDNPDVDIYVLAIISKNDVTFVGWEYKKNICIPNNIRDLGRGDGYVIDQNNLRPFKTIKKEPSHFKNYE